MRTIFYSEITGKIKQIIPDRVQPSRSLYSRGYRAMHIEDERDVVTQLWHPSHTHVVMRDGDVVGFIRRTGISPMRAPASEHFEAKNKVRVTSLGDVLMSLPAVEAYSRRLGKDVVYITDPQMVPFLERLDWVERAVSVRRSRYPAHRIVELERDAEAIPAESRKPRPEVFADLLDVQLPVAQMPNYAVIAPDEIAWAQGVIKDLPRPIIAIAPKARIRHRIWGQERELFSMMPDATFLFITRERAKIDMPNVVSVSGKTTVTALFALLGLCDAAGVNDTGLMHVAGMLGLPYVAVFGAVHPPGEFTSLYTSIHPLTISHGAARADDSIDFPIHECGPCYNGTVYDCMGTDHEKWCMRAITPAKIAATFEGILDGAPPAVEAHIQLPPAPVKRHVTKIAVLEVGGLGDHLVRLNALRQIRPKIAERYPDAKLTYITRQGYDITKDIGLADDWEFVQKGVTHDQEAVRAAHDYDLLFDLRYSAQVTEHGEGWVGNKHLGWDSGMFIGDSLATSLGQYAYTDDEQYLSDHLRSLSLGMIGRGAVELALRGPAKFVVISNGTDPTFGLLTKRIPLPTLTGICDQFRNAGYATVEVGTKGTDFSGVQGSIDLIGKTSLEQILYLMQMENCVGVLAADTGLAHLASHLRIPTTVLFGPTDPVFWGYPGNLNLTSQHDCHLSPCWLTMPNWFTACRLVAEMRLDEPPNTPPGCMSAFNPGTVVSQALAHFDVDSLPT